MAEEPDPHASEELLLRLRDVQRRVTELADAVEARGHPSNGSGSPHPPRGARVVVVRTPPAATTAPPVALLTAQPARGDEPRGGEPFEGETLDADPHDGEAARVATAARLRSRAISPLAVAWILQLATSAAILVAVLATR